MPSILDRDGRVSRSVRLRDLHVFVAAAQAGGMTRAATELGMTQPAVSQHVADLEKAVGQPLLERGQGGVAPTPFGDALLRRAAEALDALDQGLREVDFLADPGAGEVRVGASEPYIAGGFLAAAIAQVRRHHPRLAVRVADVDTGALDFGGLRDRSLDVVLGRMPAVDACEDIEAEVLFEEPILVVAGARSAWARARATALRDLAAAPWILGPPGTAVRRLVADAFRAEGLEPPAAAVSTHSMQLRMQLLSEDDYVSSLPASLLRVNGRRWDLRALPMALGRPVPVVAATLRRRGLSPAVRLFLDHLRTATAELNASGGGHRT
ncbi:LysR family transcriptional regulator [Craurococcus roseus]|uniref:LysR family transcriptional regulator n=1 Tax=Craurococcus roseus TaxID=77585 RepID=A0ABN1ETZ2_9PROT